jgi:hypothetical protein
MFHLCNFTFCIFFSFFLGGGGNRTVTQIEQYIYSIGVHVSTHIFSFTLIASLIISFHAISIKIAFINSHSDIYYKSYTRWKEFKTGVLFSVCCPRSFTYFSFISCWLRHNRLWTMYLYRSIFSVSCPMAASILSFKRNKSSSLLLNFVVSSWKETLM